MTSTSLSEKGNAQDREYQIFIALAILIRRFLWGGEAAPQKSPT